MRKDKGMKEQMCCVLAKGSGEMTERIELNKFLYNVTMRTETLLDT